MFHFLYTFDVTATALNIAIRIIHENGTVGLVSSHHLKPLCILMQFAAPKGSEPKGRRRLKHSHHMKVKKGPKWQMPNVLQYPLEYLKNRWLDMLTSLLLILRQMQSIPSA